jgi:hypothetical protein
MSDLLQAPTPAASSLSRRGFFGRFGVGAAAAAVVLAGCDAAEPNPNPNAVVLDFANDFGVLNYAYALEQLEYAFYAAVLQGSYFQGLAAGSDERRVLQDLRDHELAHVDFFNAALGTNAIGDLTPDFSAVDFSSRASVLGTAQAFEDLGVSAYNGAGRYLADPGLLLVAGKIVSVEARHAAAIRDLLSTDPRAFAGDDIVDPDTGLDLARTPSQVLGIAGAFVTDTIELRNVPS